MATSAIPLLLGVGALLLLKSKGKDAPAAAAAGTATTETDVGGGAAAGTGNGSGGAGTTATGSSGYKNISAAMMETIQKQLIQLGYDPGAADGQWRFGGTTYKAVKKFQGDNNLEDDGKPGPITRAKLNEMTGSNSDDATPGADDPGGTSDPGDTTPSATEADLLFVPEPGPTEVAFNLKGTDYKLGANFMSNLIEGRLNSARISGWLATKTDDAPAYEDSGFEQSVDYWTNKTMQSITGAGLVGAGVYGGLYVSATLVVGTAASIPLSLAAGVVVAASAAVLAAKAISAWAGFNKEKYVKETGARWVKKYVDEAYVIQGPNRTPTRITSLERRDATVDFIADLAEKVAYFQSSEYNN